jgi:hypothetical protein
LREFHPQAGFESEAGDGAGAVSRGVKVALSPFCDQGEQGGFAFSGVGNLFGGAEGGGRVACSEGMEGFADLGQALEFVGGGGE